VIELCCLVIKNALWYFIERRQVTMVTERGPPCDATIRIEEDWKHPLSLLAVTRAEHISAIECLRVATQ
jgi:hypothetical protein